MERVRTPLFWLLVLSLAGCSPRGETRSPVLRHEPRSLTRTYGSCDSAGGPCVSIRFSYPAITRPGSTPAADSVGAYIDGEMFAALEDGARSLPFDSIASGLIDQYSGLREEFSDYRIPWTLERSCVILLDTAGVISVRFEEASFLGGAHGLEIVRLASFDAASGRRLAYGDFFKPGFEREFARLAEREFRAVRDIPDSSSLGEAGFWIEEGEFSPPQNMAVGDSALILYYNPYEVAPYAMGPTEVHIPFRILSGLFRTDGALAGFTSSLQ